MSSQEQQPHLSATSEHELRQEARCGLMVAIGGGAFYLANLSLTLGLSIAGEISSAAATAGAGSLGACAGVDGLEAFIDARREQRARQALGSE